MGHAHWAKFGRFRGFMGHSKALRRSRCDLLVMCGAGAGDQGSKIRIEWVDGDSEGPSWE
jgi:hypothetical protein